MRAALAAGILVLATALPAAAQPAPPADPGDSTAAPLDEPGPPPQPVAAYYEPPPPMPAPEPAGRRNWFGVIGLGGMGYVGREVTPWDNGDKGSGVLLEAVAGKWIGELAIGGRVEAHTDDAEHYTDSSITVIARFPLGARGRFYLEPAVGLAFHKEEMDRGTENGFAVEISGGYQLTRNRFACDLRFGGGHYRFDPSELSHGLLWVGIAIGLQ